MDHRAATEIVLNSSEQRSEEWTMKQKKTIHANGSTETAVPVYPSSCRVVKYGSVRDPRGGRDGLMNNQWVGLVEASSMVDLGLMLI